MAKRFARAQQVEHTTLGDDLDRALADDSQVLQRPVALGEDGRPAAQRLELDRLRDPGQRRLGQRVERRMGTQEVADGEGVLAGHRRRACPDPTALTRSS